LFKLNPYERLTLAERLRTEGGRRAAALGLALLLEAILILLLLTLGDEGGIGKKTGEILSTFDAGEEVEEAPEPEKPPEPEQERPPTAQAQPDQPQPVQPQAAPTPPAVQLPRETGPKVEIQQLPREPAKPSPARPPMGPPAPRAGRNDTPVVGRRANGQPVYRADWYREPTEQELAGYKSTMNGPGYGIIECQTAPNFRVENCEFIGEYPAGSRIGRAWLEASWQFKIRPPRKGNSYLVGEWVRIRLTLDTERRTPDYARQ
jgi:protein TonB